MVEPNSIAQGNAWHSTSAFNAVCQARTFLLVAITECEVLLFSFRGNREKAAFDKLFFIFGAY